MENVMGEGDGISHFPPLTYLQAHAREYARCHGRYPCKNERERSSQEEVKAERSREGRLGRLQESTLCDRAPACQSHESTICHRHKIYASADSTPTWTYGTRSPN